MKRPCRADDGIEQAAVWLHVYTKTEHAVGDNREDAVDGKKIGRQRNPKVGFASDDMSALTAHVKSADASAHKPNPQCMGEFVPEYINDHWSGKPEKGDQPQNCAQGKKPEFFACPEPLRDGSAREDSKKRLRENPADWQQKNGEDKFHPTRRDCKRLKRGRDSPGSGDVADNLLTAVTVSLPATLLCSPPLCSQVGRRLG